MKQKIVFICQECGNVQPRWVGRCPECGKWNTFIEQVENLRQPRSIHRPALTNSNNLPKPIGQIQATEQERLKSGISEFDRVLGGGLVPGSVVLLGGEPGIGKSTLLLQVLNCLSQRYGKILYISGEESQPQIKLRADRLKISSDELYLLCETDVEHIGNQIEKLSPRVVAVDSIQTVYSSDIPSTPGNVTQVRESAMFLTTIAKNKGLPIFIVGHITKDGSIAGPKILEHMVDTVLYMEGDLYHVYRILRAVKNRFGSTNEIGVFEMREAGLVEVSNPSQMLLSERQENVSGSVVISIMEGSRPILLELQALVTPAYFGVPQRTTTGIEKNRLSMLIAVLDKRCGYHIQSSDVFINVVGGMDANEPAADLGTIVAIVSNFKDIPVDPKTLIIGEVGLGGEVRGVFQSEKRIKEAAKLGFKKAIVSQYDARSIKIEEDIQIIGVRTLSEALSVVLQKK